MSSLFLLSYAVLWLIVAGLVTLVTLLYRQFGLMLLPGTTRINLGGLDVGARAPAMVVRSGGQRDALYQWGDAGHENQASAHATCVIFAVPGCVLCEGLSNDAPGLEQLASRYPDIHFLWVDSGEQPTHRVPGNWAVVSSANSGAHLAMEIPATPFMYLVSSTGSVMTKGLVNEVPDVEALLAKTSPPVGAAVSSTPS
jgi:hypothetical protein